MKSVLMAALLGCLLVSGPAAPAAWGPPGAPADAGKGGYRDGRADPQNPGPDRRMDRGDRRGGMSEEDRQGLHRDLDKANRELYRRRFNP